MTNDALLETLKHLLLLIEQRDCVEQDMARAEKAYQNAKFHPETVSSELQKFDDEHLEPYIEKILGAKPKEFHGIWKNPRKIADNIVRKIHKQKTAKEYAEIRPLLEEKYYEYYADERSKLEEMDRQKQAEACEQAEKQYSIMNVKYREARDRLAADRTVAESLKTKERVALMIHLLEEGRADNLKEVVNLMYDEERKDREEQEEREHRAQMEEYARRQCEAAESAAQSAQEAKESAERAAEEAREARQAAEAAKEAASSRSTDY